MVGCRSTLCEMARVLALIALPGLVACSFHGAALGDAGGEANDVARHDAASDGETLPDGAPLTCMQKWQQHTVMLDAGVPLTAVNSTTMDRDPWLSLDEKTLYFAHFNVTDADVFVATRTDPTGSFGAPMATTLSSIFTESKLSLTADGVLAAVSEVESLGGSFNVVLYTRDAASTTSFTRQGIIGVASQSGNQDYDPYLTPDGLRLYWAPAATTQQIEVASRATTSSTFTVARTLDELGVLVGDPAPSFDETVLLYTTAEDGGAIAYATRTATATADHFVPAGKVPGINTAGNEADAHLSKDGCRVYFARYSGSTDWDLFVATVQ